MRTRKPGPRQSRARHRRVYTGDRPWLPYEPGRCYWPWPNLAARNTFAGWDEPTSDPLADLGGP